MTGHQALAGAVQVAGGLALAPLLPGTVQWAKARLQGRVGPSPLQPYRELRRLWRRRSVVDPEGTGPVYRSAPAVVAAALVAAILVVPVAGAAPGWPTGHDALVVAGLLALARVATCLGAWDTGNGFALQGASRDLAFALGLEGCLIAALAAASLDAGSTDLRAMAAATAGTGPWQGPAHALAALAFAMAIVAETGRQPVDNPDTHLELTMIHEGPLLEYAGRDQALLQWAVGARHWIVLAVAAAAFAPHPGAFWAQLLLLPAILAAGCVALAVNETLVAKMRIYRVPRILAVGTAVALLGMLSHVVGVAS